MRNNKLVPDSAYRLTKGYPKNNKTCTGLTQKYTFIIRYQLLRKKLINLSLNNAHIYAKRLNTLYVDKSLKYHDLIQAFSRTNRVESETKPFGNIVCYRTTKERVDEAVKLFSQTDTEYNLHCFCVYTFKYLIYSQNHVS